MPGPLLVTTPQPGAVTRRRLLGIGAVVLASGTVAACTRGPDTSPPPTAPGGPEDPDRALRAEIGRAESRLIAQYAEAAAVLTGPQAARIATLGTRHAAYRQAIDPDRLAESASASPSPSSSSGSASASTSSSATASASATTSATATPSASTSPSASASTSGSASASSTPTAAQVLRGLRTAETEAATARVGQAARAIDAELIRVIVLAGAGCAGAAEVLRREKP